MSFTSYEVDNDRAFQNALDRARRVTDNLVIPLILISKDFYKSERAIFRLRGPGKYPDFGGFNPGQKVGNKTRRQIAKEKKLREVGFIYPLLKGKTQRLMNSLLQPDAEGSINQILNKKVLVIGTSIPYARFHQGPGARKKIPERKFLFIGPEAPRFASRQQMGRTERWLNILNDYIMQLLAKEFPEDG